MEAKIYFIKGEDSFELYHPIVEVKGIDAKMRGRSELLIIKDDTVYLSKEKHGLCCENLHTGFEYGIPGGGWNIDEPHNITAYREAIEEARIVTKNVIYAGAYSVVYSKPKPLVKEKIAPENQWRGYFTEVFIGTYGGEYTGIVNDEDKDDIIDSGKFYPISDVIDLLHPVHQKAIKDYLQI